MAQDRITRDDVASAVGARHELGEELEPAVVDAFLERVGELRGDVGFRDLLAQADVHDVEVGGLADPTDIDTREELRSP